MSKIFYIFVSTNQNKKMKKINLVVPEWAVCALINGDFDNLSDTDLQDLGAFNRTILNRYGEGTFQCNPDTMDLGFSWRNDINKLGGNIYSVQYLINESKEKNIIDKTEQALNKMSIKQIEQIINEYRVVHDIDPLDFKLVTTTDQFYIWVGKNKFNFI